MNRPAPRRYVGRFAPSPTGPLHFGSLVAALGSWLDARQHRGEWLIRIEDLDPPREVPGAAQQQLETLAAFGLVSDHPVLWQSQRSERYAEIVKHLQEQELAFACSCSRSDLAIYAQVHHRCVRPVDPGHQAIRLKVHDQGVQVSDRLRGDIAQSPWNDSGDFVLRRADGPYAYQLAVVVDDHDQGITDVVRGEDLLESCGRQSLLFQALGWLAPDYLHLPLITDPEGRKLSKSTAALAIDREAPLLGLRAAWQALGQDPAVLPKNGPVARWLDHAQAHFDWRRIRPEPISITELAD